MTDTFAPNAAALALRVPFRKATASNPSGNCVEVGELDDGRIAVRHSSAPSGGAILYTPGEWQAFCDGVRAGEFSRSA
ncbi:DUF397 domain-containing protein [Nocardia sp. NPDC046763]|uniref:DUF397 domain-containing protein n=1 Tax=Nocardia sp. NPDC046763 TaxID=3155256 RepID=UPI0033DC0451